MGTLRAFLIWGILALYGLPLSAQLNVGQVFNYPFNGNGNDIGSNGLNGSLIGGPSFVADRNGNAASAISFNGTNQYMEIPANVAIRNNLPVTFSFYINPSSLSTDWKTIWTMDQLPITWNGYWCAVTDSWIAIYYGDGGLAGPTSRRQGTAFLNLPLNTWTHVIGIIRGPTDMDIYIDCVPQSITYTGSGGSVSWSGSSGAVGRGPDGNFIPGYKYYNGAVDDFRYWNRELSAAEIQLLCGTCTNDTTYQTRSICSGDSVQFNGQWIDQAGQYQSTTALPNGCDSIAYLDLSTSTTDTVRLEVNLCAGDSFFFNGRWRMTTGFYQDITALPNGCDSVAFLNLIQRDTFHLQVFDTLCINETRIIGGQVVSTSGVYHDSSTTLFGCDSISTIFLQASNYSDSIWIEIEEDPCRSGFVVLRAQGAARYRWNNGATTDTIQVLYNGRYEVTGSSSCGVSSAELELDDTCLKNFGDPPSKIYIPSVFTPNGDGINEVFLPQGNGILSYRMTIYNRWGVLMFDTKNIRIGWDGTYNGILQAPGNYNFVIVYTISGELYREERGVVQLIR